MRAEPELKVRQAAEAAFGDRHSSMPATEAQHAAALMISAVARDHPAWLWKGVKAVTA